MEQTKLTKNKIRRLLGRIMVLESKTPRRSPGDFYTSKVENFRKIWITYRNQGQGGFSTTSSILVGCHFPNITARTLRARGGDRIIDSRTTAARNSLQSGCHFLPHLEHTRRLQKREHAGDFSGRRRDQHTGQIFFREIDTRRDIIFFWRVEDFWLEKEKGERYYFSRNKERSEGRERNQPHHSPYAAARIRGIARSTVEDFSGDTTETPLHTAASQHRKATHLEGGLAMRDR